MVSEISCSAKLAKKLAAVSQQGATGKLILTKGDLKWNLYFLQGNLVYATDGKHRVRRFSRALKHYCPGFPLETNQLSTTNLWEYQLLHHAVANASLSLNRAKAILASTVKEVFFTAVSHNDLSAQWLSPSRQPSNKKTSHLSLSLMEAQQILKKAEQLWRQWQDMGLSHLNPDQVPVLRDAQNLKTGEMGDNLLNFSQLFNGDNTLWDLAVNKKQSVIVLTRSLDYFVKQGAIEIREVGDLPSPLQRLPLVETVVSPLLPVSLNSPAPLIACIDDSAVVCEALEAILAPAGYRVLKIQDPLRQMSRLVDLEPALIFLDLIMPDPSGYALCEFLRKTSVFRNTPIIILTGHDGLVERVRTKFTGASDFLSKPPTAKKVLQMVEKHLCVTTVSSFPLSSPPLMA